jgi:hypothetical protein
VPGSHVDGRVTGNNGVGGLVGLNIFAKAPHSQVTDGVSGDINDRNAVPASCNASKHYHVLVDYYR